MPDNAASPLFPSLNTSRLRLRQLRPTDAPALFAIKSDLEVTRHYAQEPHRSLDDTLDWIQRLQASYERHDDFGWALTLKGDDTLIGSVTLWNFDASRHCAEIGYELHRSHEKHGFMTEAVAAVLSWAFTELELHRIEATPSAENPASQNLLRRLGFTLEGTLRQRLYFRGHFEDQLYFGLLHEEWLKSG